MSAKKACECPRCSGTAGPSAQEVTLRAIETIAISLEEIRGHLQIIADIHVARANHDGVPPPPEE